MRNWRSRASIQRSLRLLLNWAPACDLTCHMASLPKRSLFTFFLQFPPEKSGSKRAGEKREGKGWMRHEVKRAWTARWEERDQVKAGGEIKGGGFRKFSVFFCFFFHKATSDFSGLQKAPYSRLEGETGKILHDLRGEGERWPPPSGATGSAKDGHDRRERESNHRRTAGAAHIGVVKPKGSPECNLSKQRLEIETA